MPKRVIVITGASGGIGAELARLLGARGDAVVLVARREAELAAVAQGCGPDAVSLVADVTVRDDVRRIVRDVLDRFGRLDVWVNNAGVGITRNPSELTDEDMDAMVLSNVKSVMYGMQEVLPHFKERGRGHVINVSSMLGRVPFAPIRSAYSGAKHFMNALTACFRAEVQQTHPDVQFSIVSPGVVHTDFGLNALHGGPDSRQMPDAQTAQQVAEVIAGVVESRHPDVYTRVGAGARVAGYYAALSTDP